LFGWFHPLRVTDRSIAAAMKSLSLEQKRTIAFQAATLDERLSLGRDMQGGDGDIPPTPEAATVLRQWQQAFAPSDTEAFNRRLAWDGLDAGTVLRALSTGQPAEVHLPAWTDILDRIASEAVLTADEILESRELPELDHFSPPEEPPFLELAAVALRAGRSLLSDVNARTERLLSPGAMKALERQLLEDVTRYCELAVFETFRIVGSRREKPTQDDAGEGRFYREFVWALLADGLAAFFTSYPVVARQIARVVECWAEATNELLSRLESDRVAIGDWLCAGRDPGRVQWVEPALSDPHDGRRRVCAIGFESGLSVVYKPRDVGLESAFEAFLDWASERGLEPRQHCARVLDRDGYGWMEYVRQAPFETVAEVRGYYRKAGGLLCIAHLLRATDLHVENVVATVQGPVLIDLELLFQPEGEASGSGERETDHGLESADGSCLATGLLTFVQSAPDGRAYDVGGLRGRGTGPATLRRRVWHNLRSDALQFTEESTFELRAANAVVLDGKLQDPGQYADELLTGFEETWRFVLAHRDELLSPAGPLSIFAGRTCRVAGRSSNQYGTLAYVLAAPKYQREGALRSAAIEVLFRPFNGSPSRPRVWPVLTEEKGAIDRLDVPRLWTFTNDTGVYAGRTRLLEHHFSDSGLSAATTRLEALSEEGLRRQLRILERALSETVETRFVSELVLPRIETHEEDDGTRQIQALVAHALWIGNEIVTRDADSRRAVSRHGMSDGSDFRRLHLYDGAIGTALFMAALARITGGDSFAYRAREAAQQVGRLLDDPRGESLWGDERLGACSGLGSVVYGLTCIGRLLEDSFCTELAVRTAALITRERIETDRHLDVFAGAAGAILALLPLYRETGERRFVDAAIHCGERLLEAQVRHEAGVAWRSSGRLFTGFAHGAAGIGHALFQLFGQTGRSDFLQAAMGSLTLLQHTFSKASGNWPIAVPLPEETRPGASMTAWCHGAPGIALAGSSALDFVKETSILPGIESALRTTEKARLHSVDHPCCGNAGRIEVLLTAGRRAGLPWAVDSALSIASKMLERARRVSHFRLSSSGYDYRVFDPGFFRGLSGIGYHLLRMAAPLVLPSILSFEAGVKSPKSRGAQLSANEAKEPGMPEIAEGLELRPLEGGQAPAFQAMTFPAYRHLLPSQPSPRHPDQGDTRVIQPFGIAAWRGAAPVGLALAETPLYDGSAPELLSLFVTPALRGKGIATALVKRLEDELAARGFGEVTAVYMTGRPAITAVERVLGKRGWSAPVQRSVTVRFTPEEAETTPWFGRVSLGTDDFEIFPWSELGPEEREALIESHRAAPWIREGLEFWRHDSYGFDTVSSLGVRYRGSVVGWVINHRIAADTVRFTCSFVRDDLGRRGRILPLYTESISRLKAAGCRICTFVTPAFYEDMIKFVNRRCRRWVSFVEETRGSTKALTATSKVSP
jgi:type 2 lantibiotic biosynthesis protein LanM